LPIGGVALLYSVISTGYVGHDIGCGMCYTKTRIIAADFFERRRKKIQIFEKIYVEIPVGFTWREKGHSYD
jgi:RNA-splicing ligase RtcB